MKTSEVDAAARALAKVTDQEAAGYVSPATWSELSDGISTSVVAPDAAPVPVRARADRVRGRLALAAGALVVAASIAAASTSLPGQDQPRALSVVDQGDSVIVRVVDPTADAKRLNREFARLGLNIKVTTLAVSPSRVGEISKLDVTKSSGFVRSLAPGEKCPGTLTAADPGCQEGLEVSKRLRGKVTVEFGRPAKPGEMYWLMAMSADAPGEVLHGVKFRNRTVAEVLPLIAARGQQPELYYLLSGTAPNTQVRRTVPADWYVHEITAVTNGTVSIWVGPRPEK